MRMKALFRTLLLSGIAVALTGPVIAADKGRSRIAPSA